MIQEGKSQFKQGISLRQVFIRGDTLKVYNGSNSVETQEYISTNTDVVQMCRSRG